MSLVLSLMRFYERVFAFIDRVTEGWLLPTLARFVFLAVLFLFFVNAGFVKIGDGFFGFLNPSLGAYFSIVPEAIQKAGMDVSNLSLGTQLIVLAGTWGEILLPVMIVVGLLTRIACLGMIVFIAVMTYVDVNMPGVKPETIGSLFDGKAEGKWDDHLLWAFLVLIPVLKGPGPISVDFVLGRVLRRRAERPKTEDPAAEAVDSSPVPSPETPSTSG